MATYAAKATDGTGLTVGQYGAYSETDVNNNSGKIRANGTVTSGVVGSVTTPRPVVTTFASTPIEDSVTVKDYAGKAVSGGTFAHDHVKPISSLVTSELAGVANTAILTPGNDGDTIRSINKLETLRTRRFTTAIRANKYNRVTNTFDAGFPAVAVDTLASDSAAAPTASVPGKLRYMSGSLTPTADNYAPKTVY
jgi:hypothetical protein